MGTDLDDRTRIRTRGVQWALILLENVVVARREESNREQQRTTNTYAVEGEKQPRTRRCLTNS